MVTRAKSPAKRTATANPRAVASPPSVTDVTRLLKRRLRQGDLVPGQRLVEPDVMRDTGASRGKVREALQRLCTEGLVDLHEFRGAIVKRLTREEVQQAYDMREMVEGLAARLCASAGMGTAQRRQLEALQAELDVAAAELSFDRFVRANDRYHEFIIDHAGNDYLRTFGERLRIPIFRLQFHVFYTAQTIRLSNADHRVITRAILDGDGMGAEQAMRSHVRNGLATVTRLDDSFFA